jgi:hypothetical protein
MPAADRARLRVLMLRRASEGPGALGPSELDELDDLWDAYVDEGDWRDILYGWTE